MDAQQIKPRDKVPASRKLGRDHAERLLAAAERLVVAKGKKVRTFTATELGQEEAINAMLGPTGNLRAPTLKVGTTLLVGFNEDVYAEVLGSA